MTETTNQMRIKVGLIASRGGHLRQMLFLKEAYSKYPCFLVTTRGSEEIPLPPEIRELYFVQNIDQGRWINPFHLCWAFVQYGWIYWRERPNFLISTGAGIAVPGFLLGGLLQMKMIFIEVGARVRSLSRAGSLCYRLAHLFLVQYPGLTEKYPRASYHGAVYDNLGD